MGSGDTTVRGIEGFTTEAHNAAISFALAFTVAELQRENAALKEHVAELQEDIGKRAAMAAAQPAVASMFDAFQDPDWLGAAMDRADAEPEPPGDWTPSVLGWKRTPEPAWTPEKAAEVAAAMPAMARTATPHPLSAPVAGPPGYEPAIPWPSASYALHPPPPPPAVPATDEEIAARFNLAPHQVQAAIKRGMPVVGPIVSAAVEPKPVPVDPTARTADDARQTPWIGDEKAYPGGDVWVVREHLLNDAIMAEHKTSGQREKMTRAEWAKYGLGGILDTVWTPVHLVPAVVEPVERTADDARYRPIDGDAKRYPGGAQWVIREFVADGDLWITCEASGGAIRVSRRQWSNSAPNAFCGTVGTVWTPAHLVVVAESESDPVEPPSVSPASVPAGPSGFMPSIASSFAHDDYHYSRGDAKTQETPE